MEVVNRWVNVVLVEGTFTVHLKIIVRGFFADVWHANKSQQAFHIEEIVLRC